MVEQQPRGVIRLTFSKWVLSNVFHYLPVGDALRIRQVSRKMDEACLIGFNIGVQDLQEEIDRFLVAISLRFSVEDQSRHQELRATGMRINNLLAKFIKDSTKPSSGTFKNFKELCYLQKPNHLIIKPIFAVMVLKHTFPPPPSPMDWHDYPAMHKIWAKVKGQIKKRDFLKSLEEFDIRTVTKADIAQVRTMYRNDIWMSAEMVDRHKGIATESSFSLAMYRWVNKIIEFIDVAQQMDKIGIVEIEAKMQKLVQFKTLIETLLARRSESGPFMIFNTLRSKQEVVDQLELISESYYSSNFEAFSAIEESDTVDLISSFARESISQSEEEKESETAEVVSSLAYSEESLATDGPARQVISSPSEDLDAESAATRSYKRHWRIKE